MVHNFAKSHLTTILHGLMRFNNTLHSDEQTNLQLWEQSTRNVSKKYLQHKRLPSTEVDFNLL